MKENESPKKQKRFIKILIISLVTLLLLVFCLLYIGSSLHEGTLGFSFGIKTAKDLGVFYDEYIPDKRLIYINQNVTLQIGEAWIERIWFKGRLFNPVIKNKHSYKNNYFDLYVSVIYNTDKRDRSIYYGYGTYLMLGDSLVRSSHKGSGEDLWMGFRLSEANKDTLMLYVLNDSILGVQYFNLEEAEKYAEAKITLSRVKE